MAIRSLADALKEQPDVEVLHEPETGILCLRMTPMGSAQQDLDALQKHIYQQVMRSGERSISMTSLDGVTALRLVVVSPHTTYQDLMETIHELQRMAERIARVK
jgi:L-2,4-diaminobutyrate decarboxylase